MSDFTKDFLKDSLSKLQCYFTWNLFEEDLNIDNIQERLYEQIAFQHHDKKHRLYNLLAYLKHLKGDNDDAILQLQKAEILIQEAGSLEDLDVQRIVTYGNYAWVFFQQNQFIKSHNYVTKVEKILKKHESPSMQSILLLEIYAEKGWSYFTLKAKWYEKAAECFEKALELDPENPELNSGYAIVLYRMECMTISKNPTDRSVPALLRAVQLNPTDTVVKTLLALKYQDLKAYGNADTLIKEVMREEPESPFILKYVAKFYRRKHMINDAIVLLNKSLHLTPNSASLNYQLGICYKQMVEKHTQSAYHTELNGQHIYTYTKAEAISKAIFYLERAVKLNTTFVAAYIVLAKLYAKTCEYEKAEETFKKTLSMKNINFLEKQELHYSWACYERFFKKDDSKAITGKHLKEAMMVKGQSFFREYAMEDLKSFATTMIAQNRVDPTGYGLLGFIHLQEGQGTLATKCYKTALHLEPGNKEYLEALSTLQSTFSCLSVN